jgi:hypothetical protein
MRIKLKPSRRQWKCPPACAVALLALLVVSGCVSSPGSARVESRVMTAKPVSMDNILVAVSSSAGGLEAEKHLLGDSLISGLRQTGMFAAVSGDRAGLGDGDGIKLAVEVTAIKAVSDNAREWAGALAGRASIVLRVSVAGLKSGNPIEAFDVEGQSGKSAFAGTTDEAIQRAAQQVVAEMLRLNVQSGQ